MQASTQTDHVRGLQRRPPETKIPDRETCRHVMTVYLCRSCATSFTGDQALTGVAGDELCPRCGANEPHQTLE